MTLSAFEAYFIGQYGKQRWSKILAGLSRSRPAVVGVLLNGDREDLVERTPGMEPFTTDWPPGPHHNDIKLVIPSIASSAVGSHGKEVFFPPPPRISHHGPLGWYWMDIASLIPPLMLDVHPGQSVLDACAAPGGKSCVIGRMLFKDEDGNALYQHGSHLTCNEPNAKRRAKLQTILSSYFGPIYSRHHITVTGRPAEKKHTALYDRILVDAPCTHERHVLNQSTAGVEGIQRENWSVARCKRMSALQLRMVISAATSLKEHGRMVYSTCSLDERQNDRVIDKACEKVSDVRVISHDDDTLASIATVPVVGATGKSVSLTPTQHGWMALPDAHHGWGPMYMSVLKKE